MELSDHFRFGPFCLEAGERVLLRDGRIVPLAPKALSTLLVLVRNMGHLVEKDVLMAEVWPDEVVEEGNLAQHIFALRKALGESPQYIETVPRRGYRFLDTVSEIKAPSTGHTENPEVYQAYLRGRYCWTKHTREGLERATGYFRRAIDLGPGYAPAYAGIIDCYLRLATNYVPLAEALPKTEASALPDEIDETLPEVQAAIKVGCEWDQKIAEREYKRAAELKSEYPAVHQWHAAYLFSRSLYEHSLTKTGQVGTPIAHKVRSFNSDLEPIGQLQYSSLTSAEKVQVFCVIARAQIDAGNYHAACAVLERWWTMGKWPRLERLSPYSSADLLCTVGTLAGWVASIKQVPRGQKYAEALLSGAIGIFEQLGSRALSAEGRVELGFCYYREGMFDLARPTLEAALEELADQDPELRSICLIRLASVERHAGRPRNSFAILKEVAELPVTTAWATARYHIELATNHSEARDEQAIEHFERGLHKSRAAGNHLYNAIAENNYGHFLLKLGRLDESESRLMRARKLFDGFGDKVRRAQADETLAQLHFAAQRFDLADQAILRSIQTLETGGEEALLAESLTTRGRILARLDRLREAKRVLDRAYAVAERCGDSEGAANALLTKVEEMCDHLEDDERLELGTQLDQLLAHAQRASTLDRLTKCHELIATAHASLKAH